MGKALVTIVIPVYNGSDFMEEAIDSALAQTYENCEILVVNDGSRDHGETEKIALSYGDRIKYFKKENGGTASALNLALENMQGDYFAWLSHDDIYYPEKIARQVGEMESSGYKASFCDYHILREGGLKSSVTAGHCYPACFLEKGVFPVVNGMIQFGGVLLGKEIIEKYGKFNEQLKTTQDFEYLFRILKKEGMQYIPETLYAVRYHEGQGSRNIQTVHQDADNMYEMFLEEVGSKEREAAYGSGYNYYYQMLLNIWPQKHLKRSWKKCLRYLAYEADYRCGAEEIPQFLQDKRIYIYGAGNYGKRLLLDMQIRGIEAEGFIDRDMSRKEAEGLPCISPEEAEGFKKEILVIAAALEVDGIVEGLKARGFPAVVTKSQFDTWSIQNPPRKETVLPAILNQHYEVCIYGAGQYGLECYFLLKDSGVQTAMFCDRDKQKWGFVLDDVSCISYEELEKKGKEKLVIFICIKNPHILKQQFTLACFPHVYTREDILGMAGQGIINPYKNEEGLDIFEPEKIRQIDWFREAFYKKEADRAKLPEPGTGDKFEEALVNILRNADKRRQ